MATSVYGSTNASVILRVSLHDPNVGINDAAWRDAVAVASTNVAESLTQPSLSWSPRTVDAITGYLLRGRTRAVAHGLFAGTAPVMIGESAVRWGGAHRLRSQPDGDWLGAVIRANETDREVLAGLRVEANPLAVLRGGRYHCLTYESVGRLPDVQYRAHDRSVAATAAARLAVTATQDPAPVAELIGALVAAAGGAVPEAVCMDLVATMVVAGVLLTDLWPPPGAADPLGHVLGRLPHGPHRAELDAVRSRLAAVDAVAVGYRRPAIFAAVTAMTAVAAVDRPLRVDVVADVDVALPQAVIGAAAQAATLLWRLTPAAGNGPVERWCGRLAQRYGRQPVALLEAVDEVRGVGDLEILPAETAPVASDRASALADLAAWADPFNRPVLDLTDELIGRLTDPDRGRRAAPRSVELHAQVLAADAAALAAGRWKLALVGWAGSLQAGAVTGRLGPLVPRPSPEPEVGTSDVLFAEIACRPLRDSVMSVIGCPGRWPYRISVGCLATDPARELRLNDLTVRLDADSLPTIEHRPTGRRVVAAAMHRANLYLLPPVVRLLLELCRVRHSGWGPFDWGPFRFAPYLPRLTHDRLIVFPATWRVPLEVATAGTDDLWEQALQRWRKQWNLPRHVVAGRNDERLILDLDDPGHLPLLRREIRAGADTVCEPAGGLPSGGDWIGGRAHELVFSLHAPPGEHGRARRAVRHTPAPGTFHAVPRRPHLPGGQWISAYLRQPARLHDETLKRVAAQLLPEVIHQVDRWHYLRYSEPGFGEHLRLRLHPKSAEPHGAVLAALHRCAAALTEDGMITDLALATYEPELHRYGGPEPMGAAEQVMACDSAHALHHLGGDDEQITATALTVLLIATSVRRGNTGLHVATRDDAAALAQWIGSVPLERTARARLMTLRPCVRAQAARLFAAQPSVAGRDMTDLRQVCERYGHQLQTAAATGGGTVPAHQASASLAHLACNRRVGTDRDTERIVLALAADAAQALIHRRTAASVA